MSTFISDSFCSRMISKRQENRRSKIYGMVESGHLSRKRSYKDLSFGDKISYCDNDRLSPGLYKGIVWNINRDGIIVLCDKINFHKMIYIPKTRYYLIKKEH